MCSFRHDNLGGDVVVRKCWAQIEAQELRDLVAGPDAGVPVYTGVGVSIGVRLVAHRYRIDIDSVYAGILTGEVRQEICKILIMRDIEGPSDRAVITFHPGGRAPY